MEFETMRPEMRRISIGLVTSVSTSGHHQISSKQCSSRPKHFIIHLHTVIQDNFTFYTLLMQHRDTLALEVNVQQQECLVFLLFCVNVCFYLAIKPKIVKENEVNPWIFKLLWRFIIFLIRKKLIFNPVICEIGVNMMRVVMVTLCGGPSRRQECR